MAISGVGGLLANPVMSGVVDRLARLVSSSELSWSHIKVLTGQLSDPMLLIPELISHLSHKTPHYVIICINLLRPEFPIVIFIHNKTRIAVAIPDL